MSLSLLRDFVASEGLQEHVREMPGGFFRMQVGLRGADVGMAHPIAHVFNGYASSQQLCAKRMA